MGRFINADDVDVLDNDMSSPISKNLFTYCQNNPVNYSDENGYWVMDAIFMAADVANFSMKPTWGKAAWLLVDAACFVDPTGTASTGLHALRYGSKALKVIDTIKISEKTVKTIKFVKNTVKPLYKIKILGKGSTGRTIARNLKEQLAMKQVLSNPLKGAKVCKKMGMNDKRWSATDGWVKMESNVNGIEIHFVYNKKLNAFDDFKFI